MTLYQLPRVRNDGETQEGRKKVIADLFKLWYRSIMEWWNHDKMSGQQAFANNWVLYFWNPNQAKQSSDNWVRVSIVQFFLVVCLVCCWKPQTSTRGETSASHKKLVAPGHFEVAVHIRPRAYSSSDARPGLAPGSFGHWRLFPAAEGWNLPVISG
jgi:hypothetical protein